MLPRPEDPELEALLEQLRARRGLDVAGFSRSAVERSVRARMRAVGVESFAAYGDLLGQAAGEAARLSHAVIGNYTAFLRDAPFWEVLAAEALPEILAAGRPARAWSAGCSSGQEPYTVAMVAAEASGLGGLPERLRVVATDVDDHALEEARRGCYAPGDLDGVPARWRRRYFRRSGDGLRVHPGIAACVEFGRHDLTRDPPVAGVHLVVCRHTLMYLDEGAQAAALSGMHRALNEGGFLFLEATDRLLGLEDRFAPVRARCPIFRKLSG